MSERDWERIKRLEAERDEWRRISAEAQADHGKLQAEADRLQRLLAEVNRQDWTAEETLGQARLYGEKMLRDANPDIQRCGADLLQITGR